MYNKTEKRRVKQKCKIGDVEISSILLQDEIAFIKTTIVPNILEIEGYRQVRVPYCWQEAADNNSDFPWDSLQMNSYAELTRYFSFLLKRFVDYDGNYGQLINAKIAKYENQSENNNKKRIEMEIRVIPNDDKFNHKLCRILVHSRNATAIGTQAQKIKSDGCAADNKYEKMKNGIIEYYSSFNQLSNNCAPWLTDNSKYIGYINSNVFSLQPIYSQCEFDGWGEVYTKNCKDKLNEYTLVCKCRFKDNKLLLSSIIDSSYRETVENFIKHESGNQFDINQDVMFSNPNFRTIYVENQLKKNISQRIDKIVKYQKKIQHICSQSEKMKMIDDKSEMFDAWLPIMNIKSQNGESNTNTIQQINLENVKINFLKSVSEQISKLFKIENQNYVLFSTIGNESKVMKPIGCHNSDFIQYLIDNKILNLIDLNSIWNLLFFICESGSNHLFKQVLSSMKYHIKLRNDAVKQEADYQQLLNCGKRKHRKYFIIPRNPANILLRRCYETGVTSLHVACINANFDIISKIFDNILLGSDFNDGGYLKQRILHQTTRNGWNLLGLSIIHDHDKIFEYLVNNYKQCYQLTNSNGEIQFGDRLGSLNGFSIVELAFESESWNVLNSIFSEYIWKLINDIQKMNTTIEKNDSSYQNNSGCNADLLQQKLKQKQSQLFNFYHTRFNDGMSLKEKVDTVSMRQLHVQDQYQRQAWIDPIEQLC